MTIIKLNDDLRTEPNFHVGTIFNRLKVQLGAVPAGLLHFECHPVSWSLGKTFSGVGLLGGQSLPILESVSRLD